MNGYEGGQVTRSTIGREVDAPPPLSPVQSATSRLDSEIGALHEALSMLTSRLQPVLGPAPGEKNGTSAATPVPSTVSQRIVESADSVRSATGRIQALLDRLEV